MARNPLLDYVFAGERYPSVTEILKLGGCDEYVGVDAETLRRASLRGRQVHWLTEQYDLGLIKDIDRVPLHRRGYVLAYKRFRKRERYVKLHTEQVVVSHQYRFAGRPDRDCYIGRRARRTVLDLKAIDLPEGKDIWGLQTAGYEIAIRETRELPSSEKFARMTLCLNSNGGYWLQEWPRRADYDDFIDLARKVNRGLRRGRLSLPEVVIEDDEEVALEPAA